MYLNQLTQLGLKEILGLTVIGALVTTTGTLIALFLKEWFFARSLEDWKMARLLEAIYRKYKDPILLSAIELCHRLDEICREHPADFLKSQYLRCEPKPPSRTSAVDPYFNNYKLQSSVYRLCAFLGWLELFRQDIVFLKDNKKTIGRSVEEAVSAIRSDLADGQHNVADDWHEWCDVLIFREEQRAIGESMITAGANGRVILGYGEFSQIFNADPPTWKSRWIDVATHFFIDQEPDKDFRHTRLKRLIVHLVDLIEALDASRITERHKRARSKYQDVLSNAAA